MMLNLVLESKNSKNIYSIWINETADYCLEVGVKKVSILGVIQNLVNKYAPEILQTCAIKVILFNNCHILIHLHN